MTGVISAIFRITDRDGRSCILADAHPNISKHECCKLVATKPVKTIAIKKELYKFGLPVVG